MPKKEKVAVSDEVEAVDDQPLDAEDLSEVEQADGSVVGDDQELSWTASEFITHEKNRDWYVLWTIGAIILTFVMYLVTRSIVTVLAIIVGSILLAIYAGRQPRELEYRLDGRGFTAGDRTFLYEDFRSFTVIDDGAFARIDFIPLKRFSQIQSVYFHPADEDAIVDLLSNHLPYEEREQDNIERLMRRLRF